MKIFPALFDTEKNKPAGIAPVWILKCPFASGTVYLSDQIFTVAGWDGGPTTFAWVRDWGQVNENISGIIAAPMVADMSVKLIIDSAVSPNIESILDDPTNAPETTDCELYLWFMGLNAATDPPQLMWTGNMIDWTREDELVYAIDLVDQSVRLDKYVGVKIDTTTYPLADPDDIGKVAPIVYGAVKKVPALAIVAGALDYLDAAIDDIQTTLTLVDATEFPTSGTIGIEDEQLTYTGKTGDQLTGLTRGANATIAAIHGRGSVTWEERSDFTYLVADHPIKQFDNIYAEGQNTLLKITGVVTLYTGQAGSQHATWPNKAIAVVPARITKSQAVDLLVNDGIAVNDAITVVDGIGVSDTITVNDLLNVTDTIGVSNPSHDHGTSEQSITQYPISPAIPTLCQNSGSWAFPTVSGTVIDAVYNIDVGSGSTTLSIRGHAMTNNQVNIFTDVGVNAAPASVGWTGGQSFGTWVNNISRTVRYTAAPVAATQNSTKTGAAGRSGGVSKGGGATKTGAATKGGAVTKTGTVTMTGNSVADTTVADRVLVDLQGYQDDSSGTYTGTPTALIERPDYVVNHFVATYGGLAPSAFVSDAGPSFAAKGYKFAVVINEYRRLKEWLQFMAWQCRCWYRSFNSQAHLLYRPDALISDKTITAAMVRMKKDSKTSMRIKRSPLGDLINKVTVHYDRDWVGSGGTEESYRGMTESSDSVSITKYGEKEKPDLFFFDFVVAAAMAQDLRDFYLGQYKDRKKLVSFDVYLDNSELEFGDAITIPSITNSAGASLVAEIEKSGAYPGSGREMRIDRMNIVARGNTFSTQLIKIIGETISVSENSAKKLVTAITKIISEGISVAEGIVKKLAQGWGFLWGSLWGN